MIYRPIFKSSCVQEAWSFLKFILKTCIYGHVPIIKKTTQENSAHGEQNL